MEWLLLLPVVGFFFKYCCLCDGNKDEEEPIESECRGCPKDTAPDHMIVTIPPMFNVWPPDPPEFQCTECPAMGGDYVVPASGDQMDPLEPCRYEVIYPSPAAGECNIASITITLDDAGPGQYRMYITILIEERSDDGTILFADGWTVEGSVIFTVDCDAINETGIGMLCNDGAVVCYGADNETAPPGEEQRMNIDVKAP